MGSAYPEKYTTLLIKDRWDWKSSWGKWHWRWVSIRGGEQGDLQPIRTVMAGGGARDVPTHLRERKGCGGEQRALRRTQCKRKMWKAEAWRLPIFKEERRKRGQWGGLKKTIRDWRRIKSSVAGRLRVKDFQKRGWLIIVMRRITTNICELLTMYQVLC